MIATISVGVTTAQKPLAQIVWDKLGARFILGWFLFVELWFHR